MEIELKKEQIPVILLLIVSIIYFYLAYNTVMLGEDEGAYFFTAKQISNLNFPAFLSQSQPLNYPPLMPLASIPFFTIFGFTMNVAKIVVCLFGVLTLFLILSLGKKKEWFFGLSSAFILLSITLFTNFMFLYYVEIPIAFFSLMTLVLFSSLDSLKKAMAGGAILALAFFTKFSAIFLPLPILIYALYMHFYKKDKNYLKFCIISFIIFGVLISPWIIRNIILYKYPFVDGLNFFFKDPGIVPAWINEATSTLSPSTDILSVFGVVSLILGLQGIIYFLTKKDEKLLLSSLAFLLFVLIFYVRGFLNLGISDPRYFSIVFPQLALIGGYFLNKVYETNRKYSIVLYAILFACMYLSFTVALGTAQSVRYDQNYLSALSWINQNTPKDANIFTAYGGSLWVYGQRNNVWSINEFPQVMTTNNINYIYSTLKHYNVSYVLIWRGIVANNYIVPESNLIGAFTYNFVSIVTSNNTYFSTAYQNQDNIILKLT